MGDYNTAIGTYALRENVVGDRSTAVGYYTLFNQAPSTNADMYNTAVGYFAGGAVTTGTNNTFVGALAGDATDDGINNVAVGYLALSANCGDGNTAIGIDALKICTGSTNTALGKNAGNEATSGSNNTLIGHDAGKTGSPGGPVQSDSNVLALGDENISSSHVQVDWTVSSDQRDKTDFTALDIGLDFVKALNPVTYKWDKRSKYGDKYSEDFDLDKLTPDGTHKEDWLDIGFKAQEVEVIEKAAGYKIADKTNLTTHLSKDGKQYGLQYSKFIPILVKAIQELSAEVTKLKGE